MEAVLRRVIGTEQGIESFGPLGRRHNSLGRAALKDQVDVSIAHIVIPK